MRPSLETFSAVSEVLLLFYEAQTNASEGLSLLNSQALQCIGGQVKARHHPLPYVDGWNPVNDSKKG